MKKLPLLTAALGLCLAAGCNQTSNSAADEVNVAADNGVENVVLEDGEAAGGFDESVEVVEVPAPAAGTEAAAAAPLAEAANISRRIGQGGGIERIPYEGGWGWRENGQILRTSSRDGRRVSYFRPGEGTPYLVQEGDRAFAYSRGRVERGYDRGGRPVAVDRTRREEGDRLARQSAEERARANRVAAEQPERVRRERPVAQRPDDSRRDRGANSSRDAADRDGRPATPDRAGTSDGRDSRRGADGDRRSRPDRNDERTGNETTPRAR